MVTSNKTIALNTAFLYMRMLVVMIVSIFTSRVILQTLGVEDYGIYNVVGGIVSMMGFLNGALGASTSRFLTYELGKGNERKLLDTFSASLNLHIAVAFLVLLMGETIGLWFFYEKLVIPEERIYAAFWVYQFSIITTMINFTQVPFNATLIAHENMSIYAYVGLYEAFSKLVIAYLIVKSPIDGLVYYALLLMLNQVCIQFFYRFYTSRRYKECRFQLFWNKEVYKALMGYSGWDLLGGIAVICQGQGINILLNLFFGPVVNAARAIAFQVQHSLASFVNNFLVAVRPQVVKNYAEDNVERMYSLTFYAAKFSYLLMLALVLPLCFEMNFVLHVWLGQNVPENAKEFTVIILITYLMETFHSASLMPYHAIGRIRTGNVVGGAMMISVLPISYIILRLGLPAYSVFLVILVFNTLVMVFGWWIIHRYVPFSYTRLIKGVYMPTVVVTILSVILPFMITHYFHEGLSRFILSFVVSETVLLFASYFLGLNRDERERVKFVVIKKISSKR